MYKLLLITLMIPSISYAFEDYDVDFEPSKEPDISIVRVTIDKCVTTFKVKDKELNKFASNSTALEQLVNIATDRADKGCP